MPISSQTTEEELTFVRGLQSLVQAYEEIAVMRIQQVRSTVLAARKFREGLSEVFHEVRNSNQQEIDLARSKQKQVAKRSQVALLMSTNRRLSGGVTRRLARSFIDYAKKNPGTDLAVVGSVGEQYVHEALPEKKLTRLELREGSSKLEELVGVMRLLAEYRVITVFFARFQNLITQTPISLSLGEALEKEHEQKEPSGHSMLSRYQGGSVYLFEPSLNDVVAFFDTQIFALLLQQTWSESWLSLLGSRVTAMEQATDNVTHSLKDLEAMRRRDLSRLRDKKQRDGLAGMSMWEQEV